MSKIKKIVISYGKNGLASTACIKYANRTRWIYFFKGQTMPFSAWKFSQSHPCRIAGTPDNIIKIWEGDMK